MTITCPDEVFTFTNIANFIKGREHEITMTMLFPFWLFPTYVLPSFNCKGKITKMKYNMSENQCMKKEVEIVSDILLYKNGMPVSIVESKNIDKLLDTLKKLSKIISEDCHVYSNDATMLLFNMIRSTTPVLSTINIDSSYGELLNVLTDIPEETQDKWHCIDDIWCFKNRYSIIHMLNFMRFRSKSNYNLFYRATNESRIKIGNKLFKLDEISELKPIDILNMTKKDSFNIGVSTLRKCTKKDIPRRIRSEDTMEISTVLEGPGTNLLFIGNCIVETGTRKEFTKQDMKKILNHEISMKTINKGK